MVDHLHRLGETGAAQLPHPGRRFIRMSVALATFQPVFDRARQIVNAPAGGWHRVVAVMA